MSAYELIDFGDGRRLERFGEIVTDRPCPSADSVRKSDTKCWLDADFCFVPDMKLRQVAKNSERGRWTPQTPGPFLVDFGLFRMELRGTPFGHLGVFPEQQANWQRIAEEIDVSLQACPNDRAKTIRVLNLFAYSGGSSLAAAGALPSVEVVHVDSSKSVVDRARRNGELNEIGLNTNGLPDNKGRIRFIVEDVRKFVRRELKRGNRYDAVILDPPTYGHGVKGETWKLADDLPGLLSDVIALLVPEPVFVLLTAHTPGFGGEVLHSMLLEADLPDIFRLENISMNIQARNGAVLSCGCGVFAKRLPY